MRKSLSMKMLILTFGSFLILMIFIFASIYIYFDHFYEPAKIHKLVNAINGFTASFEKNQWPEEQLYSEVSDFMNKYDVTLSIGSDKENAVAVVKAMRGEFISYPDYLILNSPKKQVSLVRQPSLYDYIRNSRLPFRPYAGKSFLPGMKPPIISYSELESGTTARINGNIVFYPKRKAYPAVLNGYFQTGNRDGVFYTISNIRNTNFREIHFTKQSTLDNGEDIFVDVNASLQTVDEVIELLSRFFPYLIGAAILLSVLMAYVYSKIIAKPIVKLTQTANRMAKMELGIVSEINRKDELGALSSSLNTLSSNLKNALDELSSANDQLKEDYENELRQEKTRKEFVANVSHELKTPLGIIKSYSEGLRDGIKREKKDHYMQVILEEIDRMDCLILEMLEISRFDAGAVTYHKQNVSFDQLLNKKVSHYAEKAWAKEAAFQVTGSFGTCLFDEEKIGRVLDNLLSNAVKYCDPGSVITILGETSTETLKVSIENECPIFSEEILTKLWERFYKADCSHNRDTEGTGLGLAITKSILEGHGSTFGVYNTDRGIGFYFTLETI